MLEKWLCCTPVVPLEGWAAAACCTCLPACLLPCMHCLLAAPTLPLCTALGPAAGKQLNYLTGVVVKPVKEPVQVRTKRRGRGIMPDLAALRGC